MEGGGGAKGRMLLLFNVLDGELSHCKEERSGYASIAATSELYILVAGQQDGLAFRLTAKPQ